MNNFLVVLSKLDTTSTLASGVGVLMRVNSEEVSCSTSKTFLSMSSIASSNTSKKNRDERVRKKTRLKEEEEKEERKKNCVD